MVRFANIVIGYFIIAAVMWGGGAIDWDNSGVGSILIDNPDKGEVNRDVTENLNQSTGPIQQASQAVGGGLIAVWNITIKIIGVMFWPILTLTSVSAPPSVVVLLGGTPTAGFYVSLIRVIRGSA